MVEDGEPLGGVGNEDVPRVLARPAGVQVAPDGVVRWGDDAEVRPEPRRGAEWSKELGLGQPLQYL